MNRLLRGIPKVFQRRHRKFLRFYLLTMIGRILTPSYRFKLPDMDWWQDGAFDDYLDRFGERTWLNTERRWMLYQLLRLIARVPGDTAECGVYRGASSYLICSENATNDAYDRTHHVFDSFEGLSDPDDHDGSHWVSGDLAVTVEEVQAALSAFPAVSFYKGWIPERFPDVEERRFAFVHIDVDLFAPTRDSMVFFYDRMNEGGIILCDDYGGSSCVGATEAVDTFLADKPEKMIALPSNGGFMIKGKPTAVPFVR